MTCSHVNSLNHQPINDSVFKEIIVSWVFYMVIVHPQLMNNNSRVLPFWFQCHLSYADFQKLMNIQSNRIVLNICKQNMKRRSVLNEHPGLSNAGQKWCIYVLRERTENSSRSCTPSRRLFQIVLCVAVTRKWKKNFPFHSTQFSFPFPYKMEK